MFTNNQLQMPTKPLLATRRWRLFSIIYCAPPSALWTLTGCYTAKKQQDFLTIKQAAVNLKKETFLILTRLVSRQQHRDLVKFNELIKTGKEIIAMGEKIQRTSGGPLQNVTSTGIDYLSYVNAADQARQDMVLRQRQLLLTQYNYQTPSGN